MEGLGGLKESREIRYGRMLTDRGYVALVIDGFGARRLARTIETWRALRVTTAMMLADAFSGLRFLKQDLAVDPSAISIIGFSYGGMVSVLAAYEQVRSLFARSCAERFAGHVPITAAACPDWETRRPQAVRC
jgi:dienelactone hydrolase